MAGLEPIVKRNLDVIFVGTAVAERSAMSGHYYANPRNRFWELLHLAGLTPRRLDPSEDATLIQLGMGITDVVPGITQSNDLGLRAAAFTVDWLLEELHPQWIAFNGKTAAKLAARALGEQPPGHGEVRGWKGRSRVFVLPSSSSANAGARHLGGRTKEDWWREFGALASEG